MFSNLSRDKAFYRTVRALTWPIITQGLMNNSLAFVDSFMLGNLGERYLSAIQLANTVFSIAMLSMSGLQSGSAVLIAQYHGKKDTASINKVIGIGVMLSFCISMLIAIPVFFAPVQVYSLTTNDVELAAIAAEYGRIAAFSIVFNAISVIYLSAQRSMENPKLFMRVMVSSMTLKTFLNWVFIYGMFGVPAMGIRGAATATLLARTFEFLLTSRFALFNKQFKLQFREMFRPGKTITMDYIRYSLPVVINESIWGFGSSMYTIILGHLPNAMEALASYAIIMNVERMVSSFHTSLSHVAAMLVGKELGADRKDSAYQTGLTMATLTAGMGACSGSLIALLSQILILPYVFPFFGASASTQAVGSSMILIAALSMPFRAMNFGGIVGVLRGGGDVKAAVAIDLGAMYGVGIPLTWLAGMYFGAPVPVVFFAMQMDEIAKAVMVVLRLRSKKWLRNITREAH